MNIYKEATRTQLRFPTPIGPVATEDLWDLPLTSKTGKANLDDIARVYSRELKAQGEESFVTKPAQKDKTLQLAFDIVKDIIDTKLEERDALKKTAAKKAAREEIMGLIKAKEAEALGAEDIDSLRAKLKELEG